MTGPIYPLIFTPHLMDYIWGGRNLETIYNRDLPPGIIAESWEISGHPDGPTQVNYGPLAGQTLPDLLAALGPDLVGARAEWALNRNTFPLLVKLLDANRNLSVQVHPNDNYALHHENGALGKTEMWYVLGITKPDAQIIFGLKSGTTPENFRQAIANNTLEDRLHYLPVKAGDTIFVEAGSIHAVLEGVLIAEIQQSSNITYRVYDWGRVGADGRPRELHVDKALAVTNFDQIEPGPYSPRLLDQQAGITRFEISRCDYFVVEAVKFDPETTYTGKTDGSTLEIWGTVEGHSLLQGAGYTLELPVIRFCLIPAALGDFSLTAQTPSKMLRIYLP